MRDNKVTFLWMSELTAEGLTCPKVFVNKDETNVLLVCRVLGSFLDCTECNVVYVVVVFVDKKEIMNYIYMGFGDSSLSTAIGL
jgi:hypothetical protein